MPFKKKPPVGTSDFKEIIEENFLYSDKSLLIKDIIDAGKVVLVTRPRRFGKTTNQFMLKYFFEKEDKSNGYLFENLKISKEKECMEKQGKYPVIFLTFKDVKRDNFEPALENIKRLIAKEYSRHDYLLSIINKDHDKEIYKKICSKQAGDEDYQESLLKLSQYLYEYYGKKAIILIDEYDTPIIQAYSKNYYDKFIDFFKQFLSECLKDNVYLEKAVLTGILRVSQESIFSGLNNFDPVSILHERLNDKYGLTEKEVFEAINTNENIKCKKDTIVEWYDGYNFGGENVYNPFSIMSLILNNCDLQPYWVNTSSNQLVLDLIKDSGINFKEKIFELMDGKIIKEKIDPNIVYSDLKNNETAIWTLLLFSGYLTWEDKKLRPDGKFECSLKIPNKEALLFYKRTISRILENRNLDVENIFKELLKENHEYFKENFKKIVTNSLSYFDITGEEPERFYHLFVMGMIIGLQEEYEITSNREAGFGRADIILKPKDENKKGLIIEFKKFKKNKDKNLFECAVTALNQINEKKYDSNFKNKENIIKLGIGFDRKNLEIAGNFDDIESLRKIYLETHKKEDKSLSPAKKAKLEIAKSLMGILDIETIALKTGLTEEEIEIFLME